MKTPWLSGKGFETLASRPFQMVKLLSLSEYDNPNQDVFNDKSIEIKTPPGGGERVAS